jgi:uncharacterized protein (DUF1800 family)
MLTPEAAIAANRFGLGARPGDRARIGRDARGWLLAQLDGDGGGPQPQTPPASARVLAEARELRVVRQVAAQARANRTQPPGAAPGAPLGPGIDEEAIREFGGFIRDNYLVQAAERHRLAIETDRPFVERLVHFWSNHFAVSADKQPLAALAGLYEQEAIRPHVTGHFYDLLLAAERHPAMILYLDNQTSMGASSAAANFARRNRGRELGLNENLAREILELHTLGVDGGYTQRDVTELAKILTGWSIGGALREGGGRLLARIAGDPGKPGEFHFREGMHEPGKKTLLGRTYPERGREEGDEALRALAQRPATARHLATKLARHFVADEPPVALVERLAAAYLDSDGHLTHVYRTLVESAESWREPLAKFKTPQDFAISAYRSLDDTPANLQPLTAFLTQVGQRPYTPGSPAGFADAAASWNGGDALLKRIEFATAAGRAVGDRIDPLERAGEVLGALSEHTTLAIRSAESGAQGFALLLAAPEFQRR